MATIAELNPEACTAGFSDLNDHRLLVMIATLLNTDMLTVDEINTLACTSGLADISSNHFLLRYIAALLNNGAGGGGGTAFNNKFGVGSPVGVVTPDYVGQYYLDTTDPYDTWFSTGLTNVDWVLNTGGITSGGGGGGGVSDPTQTVGIVDPEGAITAEPGSTYLNTDTPSFFVKGSGSGDTGWVQIS